MRILVAGAVLVAFTGCFRGDQPPSAKPTTPDAPRTASRGAAIADPLGFLPADAEMVLVVDMKPVRESPLWKRFEPQIRQRTDKFLAPIVAVCKFDPIQSLRWISIGVRDLGAAAPTGAFVIRGFDRELFMRCMDIAKAASPTTIRVEEGVVMVTDAMPVAMTFVDATTLVAIVGPNANANTLRGVIDGGAPLRTTPWFSELVAKVNTKDPAWFVLDGKTKLLAGTGLGPTRGVMGSMNVDGGLGGQMRMRMDAPDQATQLVTLAQSQVGPASGFFEELVITSEEVDVVVRVRATNAQVEMLLGLAGIP